MHIRIITHKMSLTDPLRDLVHTRLPFAFGRHARRVEEAVVSFTDVHGPRGGFDVQCRIRVRLRPRGEINVEAVGLFVGAALSRAAERACRCVQTRVQRRWTSRRRAQPAAPLHGSSRECWAPAPPG